MDLKLNLKIPIIETKIRKIGLFRSKINIHRNKDSLEVTHFEEMLSGISTPERRQISIAWIELSLKFKRLLGEEKQILNSLNGCFEFGTINALMGPSGAGKTTLLKCFNGRNKSYLTEDTKIYLNKFRTIRTCFISQDISNHLIHGLSAKESLIFASKLKNTRIKGIEHQLIANDVMKELLISDICETQTQNCSGGEQKRLVLAMELMSKNMPNLICIDEPTSGLDSTAAEAVIKCLKYLSKKHDITVITSIHQPNSDVLTMFDTLYVLALGGVCIYSGEPNNIEMHLNECGIPFNDDEYPIEELIKIGSTQTQQSIEILSERLRQQKSDLLLRCNVETKLSFDGISGHKKQFYFKDFLNLLMREIITIYRNKWKFYVLELLLYIMLGLTYIVFSKQEMLEPNGCISFDALSDRCQKTNEDIEKENLLTYNLWTQFFVVATFILFQILSTAIRFLYQVPTMLLEQRNGQFIICLILYLN